MRKPCRCNSCASLRVLLHVQRKGDSGSPRVVGPTNASRAWKSWGSAKGFRPPPLLRILPPSSAFPAPLFNSRIPAWIVLRDRPVACATSETPPCGNACASADAQSRRCRSSSTLRNAWYFLRIPPTSSFCPMRKAYHIYLICSSYLCAVPNPLKSCEGRLVILVGFVVLGGRVNNGLIVSVWIQTDGNGRRVKALLTWFLGGLRDRFFFRH